MSAALANPMIYPQRAVADQIAERLTAVKGTKHAVIKLPHGFQVAPVTVCPDYMPPAKPVPVKPVLASHMFHKNESGTYMVKEGEFLQEFPLVGEGLTYITVLHNGKSMAFGKSTLLGWTKVPSGKMALKMTLAVAKKRGLV